MQGLGRSWTTGSSGWISGEFFWTVTNRIVNVDSTDCNFTKLPDKDPYISGWYTLAIDNNLHSTIPK